MTALGERTLIRHLTDPDSLDVLAREGLSLETVPTDELRPVVSFSLDYFHQSGRERAPTVDILRQQFGDVLDDAEVDLEDAEESIEWAIDDLRGTYATYSSQKLTKDFAIALAEAHQSGDPAAVPKVVDHYAQEIMAMSMLLASRNSVAELAEGLDDRMRAYEQRALTRGEFRGMTFGLPEVDAHTFGIHDGELAIVAASPKTGKSYWMAWMALQDWRRGRTVVLNTLENSIEMTLDRLACLATHVDSRKWQRGECNDGEILRVRTFQEEVLPAHDNKLWVLQPDIGKRSSQMMVREAALRDADSLLIDQLTFMELADSNRPKTERIGEALHTLKAMISTGRDRMACAVAHQIKRDGLVAARKTGHHEIDHMAESAEVERTADLVFALYQSTEARQQEQMLCQLLAARREDILAWRLLWNVGTGIFRVLGEERFDE